MFLYSNHLMRDYLGNVRYVSGILQYTDYDPLGKIIYSSNLDKNVYLYEGKERIPDIAEEYESVYDFGARYYNPLYGRWFAPDPAKQGLNPYVYCGNNPIQLVDPDGRIWIRGQEKRLLSQLKRTEQRLERQKSKMEKLQNKNIGDDKKTELKNKIEDIDDRLETLKRDRENIRTLGEDATTTYKMKRSYDNVYKTYRNGRNGRVVIEYGSLGPGAHEREHNVQWLGDNISNKRFNSRFNDAGVLSNAGVDQDTWTANEKRAYQIQYAYDGAGPFPVDISSYKEINAVTIYNIMDENNNRLYPYAEKTKEYKQLTGQ